MSAGGLNDIPMLDLFRAEVDEQRQRLVAGLLELEANPQAPEPLEECMRAAHSVKGAARVVGLSAAVHTAHALEDGFVAAQQGRTLLGRTQIDLLLQGVDLLARIADGGNDPEWLDDRNAEIDAFVQRLATALRAPADDGQVMSDNPPNTPLEHSAAASDASGRGREESDRVLRLTADNLNRLLGLASESLVESRRLRPIVGSFAQVIAAHETLASVLARLRDSLTADVHPAAATQVGEAGDALRECQRLLGERIGDLDRVDQRSNGVAQRLYDEAVACRMRPFADAVPAWPRLVRDLGHSLGKQARLVIVGQATQVDRDILTQLDAPLGHLLRNAVDHGIEPPSIRRAAGKPETGVITIEARHRGGALQITVADDGGGIDVERIRAAVVERGLTGRDAAAAMSEGELLEFLFLPGFSLKGTVTETSGRGVGLDAVRDVLKHARGTVTVSSAHERGTTFTLHLPVTLSVVRALIADVGGEPYAFPLTQLIAAVKIDRAGLQFMEGRPYFAMNDRLVGLVSAGQVLGVPQARSDSPSLSIVIVGDGASTYGVVVDAFLEERELVVQPLDPHLGKVENIAAGALLEDGSPVFIVDTADLVRFVEKSIVTTRPTMPKTTDGARRRSCKRVLVVDDSLTVREVERKLIGSRGYEVEVAVDGMDGWNAVRRGGFDLVVTDIDMPRMDGIELVSLIKQDPALRSTPVMVVSYKDRDEDRRRGLDAGAAYYLTKSSFSDDTLVQAVVDLIGEAHG